MLVGWDGKGVPQFKLQARDVKELCCTDLFSCCIHLRCIINGSRVKTSLKVTIIPVLTARNRHVLLLTRLRTSPKKMNQTMHNVLPFLNVQGQLQLRRHVTDVWRKPWVRTNKTNIADYHVFDSISCILFYFLLTNFVVNVGRMSGTIIIFVFVLSYPCQYLFMRNHFNISLTV